VHALKNPPACRDHKITGTPGKESPRSTTVGVGSSKMLPGVYVMIAAAPSVDFFCWIFIKAGRKHGAEKTVECAVLNSQWRGAYLECLFTVRNLIFLLQ
jgi:hypothetical protein